MAHADQKHGELMQGQRFQHQMEMETMQNQLLWMMAVVGEDKISQVLNDPQQHAESMRKALEIKQGMIQTQGKGTGGVSCRKYFRDLTVEEMEEMRRVAPWACKLSRGGKAEQALRCSQLEDEYEPGGNRRVESFWWSHEDGSKVWKFHNGILPEENSMQSTQVMLAVDEEAEVAEDDLDGVYAVLNRSSRRRFEKALNKVIVSELYSQPRVAAKAEEMGLAAGSSFDLKNGYDFNKNSDRYRAWRKLKRERPDLLIVCPPCGPFSQLQSWNYKRMKKEKAMLILGEGVSHLEFAMKMFEWQVRRGGVALFEHPAGSKAWQELQVRRPRGF